MSDTNIINDFDECETCGKENCECQPNAIVKLDFLETDIELSWYNVLKNEFSKDYFKTLVKKIEKEKKIKPVFPYSYDIFNWSKVTPLDTVRVVILGQDPYYGYNQAHGLSFSVKKGVRIPPSLENIFIEVKNNIKDFKIPEDGNITKWALQGVLLLNNCLTVSHGSPNSHKDFGWEPFTDFIIDYLSKNKKDLIFLLWGVHAQKKAEKIKSGHHILKSAHPSPYSAHLGFFGNKHFSRCNELLIQCGKTPIDWHL